jgi:arabinofuranosyltransferase
MTSLPVFQKTPGWNAGTVVLVSLLSAFVYLLIVTAWVCDDAYIVFRTVDNFVNGHGLRWNVADRVQTFTDPLWMFLVSFFYFFTREAYFTSLSISIAVSIAAAAILVFKCTGKAYAASLLLLALLGSRAFVDYSTSGLENPLTHLFLILFFLFALRGRRDRRTFFLLSLTAALGMLNRMDTAILFAPGLAYAFRRLESGKAGVKLLFIGFLPFIAWECFSLWYYGSPFPNTAYAKLNTGIPAVDLIAQGLHYMKNSLLQDPVTLATIGTTLAFVATRREGREWAAGAGVLLYLLYIVRIGGDFMSGRFLAAPFVVSLAVAGNRMENTDFSGRIRHLIPVAIVVLGGVICPRPPILNGTDYGLDRSGLIDGHGISDERASYYQFTGLLKSFQGIDAPDVSFFGRPRPNIPWVVEGLQARELAIKEGGWSFFEVYSIGFFGYFAGPRAHIVDRYGLADPFIARMPMRPGPWRIGHFERITPEGYPETISNGGNVLYNLRLAAYFDKLAIITRGDLASTERLKIIMIMNLRLYDDLLDGASLSDRSIMGNVRP